MLGRLPKVLCVRLQRNRFDALSGRVFKDDRHVAFPLVLDVRGACFFDILRREAGGAASTAPPEAASAASGALLRALTGALLLAGAAPPPRARPVTPTSSSEAASATATATSTSASSPESTSSAFPSVPTLPAAEMKGGTLSRGAPLGSPPGGTASLSPDMSLLAYATAMGEEDLLLDGGAPAALARGDPPLDLGPGALFTAREGAGAPARLSARGSSSPPPSPIPIKYLLGIPLEASSPVMPSATSLMLSGFVGFGGGAASPTGSPVATAVRGGGAAATSDAARRVAPSPPPPQPQPPPSAAGSSRYALTAVVEHTGTAYGGHFVAYRRVVPPPDGEPGRPFWVRASDESVYRVSEDAVAAAQVYMCFFERL